MTYPYKILHNKHYVSEKNSTEVLLGANEVFYGKAEKVVGYGTVVVSVFSDVPSAIDGLSIQF